MNIQHRGYLIIEPTGGLFFQPTPLPGWITCGVAETANGRGALVYNRRTGIYCQANAGVLRSLPQRKVIAALAAAEPAQRIDGSIDGYLA